MALSERSVLFKVWVNEPTKQTTVCFGKIVIELKAVSALEAAHHSQVYNYLHATGPTWGSCFARLCRFAFSAKNPERLALLSV